jgi:hypothetical protein
VGPKNPPTGLIYRSGCQMRSRDHMDLQALAPVNLLLVGSHKKHCDG